MTSPVTAPALRRLDGSALRVLVVDDEQMLTDLLSMALRMEGWDVRTAGSGFQALQAARDFDPDAMVLDIMMPGMDGYDTIRAIRASPDLQALPIVALTAKAMKGDPAGLLTTARAKLAEADWSSAESLKNAVLVAGEEHGLKLGKAQAPVRVAVTGRTVGLPLFESLEILGRERTLARIDATLAKLAA